LEFVVTPSCYTGVDYGLFVFRSPEITTCPSLPGFIMRRSGIEDFIEGAV